MFHKNSCISYLVVYVDDIILTSNDQSSIGKFIAQLHAKFSIKDMGHLNYFLGLEVSYTETSLFLNQSKYVHDTLIRTSLLDSKHIATPLSMNDVFVSTNTPYLDPTHYHSLVGAFQYLTITRSHLSYVVNKANHFLHALTIDHFQIGKRILRYVKGTLTYGLTFSNVPMRSLISYSDTDWAKCIETRHSTYGNSIFLGGNLVSWSTKKQPKVSRSSCESKYCAMANTTVELIWVTHLLCDLHALPSGHPTLLCHNLSAVF